MMNKESTTQRIRLMTANCQIPATKLQLDNILFPKWSDMGPMGMLIAQCVKTKEQPNGCFYDEAEYRVVLRVLGGNVFMSGRPDSYCWDTEKISNLHLDPKNLPFIGIHSAIGIIRLGKLLETVTSEKDKNWLAEFFCQCNQDYLLITTPAEQRTVVEVTEKLYSNGLTACVDQWMKPDENGECPETQIFIGDYLVISKKGVYRIGREEFFKTHKLN